MKLKQVCIMCSHCENIDLEAGTGVCGPLEGETVLLCQRCECPKSTYDTVERLQAEFHPHTTSAQAPALNTYPVIIRQILTGYDNIQASSEQEAIEQAEWKYVTQGAELPDMDDADPLEFSIDTDQTTVWVLDSKYHKALASLINGINTRVRKYPTTLNIAQMNKALQNIASPTSIGALDSSDEFAWLREEVQSINPTILGIEGLAVYKKDGKLWNKNHFDGPWEIPLTQPVILFRVPSDVNQADSPSPTVSKGEHCE